MITPLLLTSFGQAQPRALAETSITIDLEAAPAVVLPLFGPVREAEWAQGWSPAMLYPSGGRQRAGEILIRLKESGKGHTEATVTYRRTALSPEADHGVEAFAHYFPEQRDHWQNAINQRLRALAEEHGQHN